MLKKNEQVFISMDGPDGLIIQTSRATWESYYRAIRLRATRARSFFVCPPPQDREVDAFATDGVE